jgi:glycosyltransferase involved in cell wall biosynthesis
MQIVFFCPRVSAHRRGFINGGMKYIFHMAETLRELGHNAMVCEVQGQRPDWFASTAPVVNTAILKPDPNRLIVVPEDQVPLLEWIKDWPQPKVIYMQNHFLSCRLNELQTYADYGVTDIICGSRTIYEHALIRHSRTPSHIIPCSIDARLFRPLVKRNRIVLIPRKRKIEAAYIRDTFRFAHRQYGDWEWQGLVNVGEGSVARAFGEAKVFLSLSRLEGFGLTPIEAMAAGCIVAGFTGIGGREYATPENGFWAEEDDFPSCIAQLKAAIDLSQSDGARREAYDAACAKTAAAYSTEMFRYCVKQAWARILG